MTRRSEELERRTRGRRGDEMAAGGKREEVPSPAKRRGEEAERNERRRRRGEMEVVKEQEEESDGLGERKRPRRGEEMGRGGRRRGRVVDDDDEEDDAVVEEEEEEAEEVEEEDEEEEEEAVVGEDAKPIGEQIRSSGKGKKRKSHFSSFECDGNVFELEDPVLLTPEDKKQKPYVAIIKDITQDAQGSMMVTGQWFYRPEEAPRKGGGSWEAQDTRELFYSFHLDEVPAESVMHKCIVHFVPLNKKLPIRSEHPGFIVQKVYDTVEKKLWKLTDKDYEDNKQHEIDLLVQKTIKRLGELPDIIQDVPASVTACVEIENSAKNKWNLRRKNIPPVDIRKEEHAMRSDSALKAETPGSCVIDGSEYHGILLRFKGLTGDSSRDKWLEKLLQVIQLALKPKDDTTDEDKMGDGSTNHESICNISKVKNMEVNGLYGGKEMYWPDAAVSAVTALEKVAHEAFGSEYIKYNQKMRQLDFNLKNTSLLVRRLVNKDLDPVVIVNMSPIELKEGLTAAEKSSKEPEKPRQLQMTDARCSICSEKKVGVSDIINARYQLECIACGHSWYASRDAVSSLTIDEPTVVGNVGTAPWATSKFEEIEKKLVSPRESDKESLNLFSKSTAACIPVLEKQKSFNRSKIEDQSTSAANHE